MRKTRLYFDDGVAQRARFGQPGVEAHVEAPHELRCRTVVYRPQTHDKRRRTGVKESASETQQLIAFPNSAHARFACAQRCEFGAQLQIENVEKVQPGFAEPQR